MAKPFTFSTKKPGGEINAEKYMSIMGLEKQPFIRDKLLNGPGARNVRCLQWSRRQLAQFCAN